VKERPQRGRSFNSVELDPNVSSSARGTFGKCGALLLRLLEPQHEFLDDLTAADIILILDERYHAGTYGIPDATTIEAIRTGARLEAMITDPVYEGKSLAGMIDLVRRGEIDRDSSVLYAHIGGQPALNAYAGAFL
jgi:1-aminocyclopropane-1-carboxylate deaminase